jgi:hypothetical protein
MYWVANVNEVILPHKSFLPTLAGRSFGVPASFRLAFGGFAHQGRPLLFDPLVGQHLIAFWAPGQVASFCFLAD